MARLPPPVVAGDIKAQVMASRGQDADGRWYWRARQGGGQKYVWTGRAHPPGVLAAILAIATGAVPPGRQKAAADDEPPMDTVGQALDIWWTSVIAGANLEESSKAAYRIRVRVLSRTIGHVALTQLHPRHLEAHRAARGRIGRATRTVHAELVTLVSAWRWWRDIGRVTVEPPKFTTKIIDRRDRRTPAWADLQKVLAWIPPAPSEPLSARAAATAERRLSRVRLVLSLMAATGARIGEIAAVEVDDVEVLPGLAMLHLGRHPGARKTGPRSVPVTGDALDLLVETLRTRRDELARPAPRRKHQPPRTLTGLKRRSQLVECQAWLREFPWESQGLQQWRSHGVRRLVTDSLVRAGVEVSAAATLLGHSPEVMLDIYRQVTEQDLAKAVRLAGLGDLGAGRVIPLRKRRA